MYKVNEIINTAHCSLPGPFLVGRNVLINTKTHTNNNVDSLYKVFSFHGKAI